MKEEAIEKGWLLKGTVGLVLLIGVGYGVYRFYKKRNYKTSSEEEKRKEEKRLTKKKVFPGSEGYVNVRSSPRVDNKSKLRFDFTSNLLGKASHAPVGVIEKRVKGEDGYYWYEIKLIRPLKNQTKGYVREDAVRIAE